MRLPDYFVVALVGLTTLALAVCGVVRVRDVASRMQMRKAPLRGQQADHLREDPLHALDELLGPTDQNWRENELYIRRGGER